MGRYKGRRSTGLIEREFPHFVEVEVPLGGLGRRLDAIYDWHATRDAKPHHGAGRRQGERNFVRWCFADAATADAFRAQFATIEPRPESDADALVEWGRKHVQSD